MEVVYFKTDTSRSATVCCFDGKIDLSELGQKFKLNPESIELNGIRFSQQKLMQQTWEGIQTSFIKMELPVGMEADPLKVTGDPLVHGTSTEEGSPSKRAQLQASPQASPGWQTFVQSVAKHYKEWEEADAAARANGADAEKDCGMKFLIVSSDPLGNFPKGCLIGIRECYKNLKKILVDSEAGWRFVVLCTLGIGKSCFLSMLSGGNEEGSHLKSE